MEIVRNRSRRTLTGVINQRLVGQNLTVHTDLWQGYANLPHLVPSCAVHATVNHSQNFVDPITGAHIQGMESGRNRVKYGFKKQKGVAGTDFSPTWTSLCGLIGGEATMSFGQRFKLYTLTILSDA